MISSELIASGKTFVLFLDPEDVLFNQNTIPSSEKKIHSQAPYPFDPGADDYLEGLILRIERFVSVAVVITSRLRRGRSLLELKAIFSPFAFSRCIVDKTPEYISQAEEASVGNFYGRAKEIALWLSKHPKISLYAILDSWDVGLSKGFPNNVVYINPKLLFSQKEIVTVEQIFHTQAKKYLNDRIQQTVHPIFQAFRNLAIMYKQHFKDIKENSNQSL